jgi:raffinose/stachyose/melibiose transport system permease protein
MIETHSRRGRLLLQLGTTLLILPFVYPLVTMVQVSLSGEGWANYGAVLSRPELPGFFRNSVMIAGGTVLLTYAATMLAAFAFAKLKMRFKEFFFYLILATLTLPVAALTVPLFLTVYRLGLFDTIWAVVLPLTALNLAFNVLLARGFISRLPDELLEAARIDGANTLRIFWSVILPLTRPISAVVVVWSFVSAWNEYLLPLLFLQTLGQQPVTLIPSFFSGQYSSDQTKIAAASVIIALPTVLVYLTLQRFFDRGITAGAVK